MRKKQNNWSICLSSPPDRDNLVADILCNNEQMMEVNQENNLVNVELYPRQDGRPWVVSYDQLLDLLNDAKNKLMERTTARHL